MSLCEGPWEILLDAITTLNVASQGFAEKGVIDQVCRDVYVWPQASSHMSQHPVHLGLIDHLIKACLSCLTMKFEVLPKY